MKRRNSASVIKESDGKGNNKLLRVNSTRNSLSSSILHQIEYDIVGSHGLSNSTDLSPLSSSHADSKSIRRVILLYLWLIYSLEYLLFYKLILGQFLEHYKENKML